MISKNEENIIKRLRLLEMDHDPEGWPCVTMKELTLLLDIIEREQCTLTDKIFMIRQLRAQMVSLKETVREQRVYF